MEMVKSRSVSPFSKNKSKIHFSDVPENGNSDIEQIKSKKKSVKNKCKSQSNEKGNGNVASLGKDNFELEKAASSEMGNKVNSNNTEHEDKINNGSNVKSRNGNENVQEVEGKNENDALINVCDIAEAEITANLSRNVTESESTEEIKNTKENTDVNFEDCSQQCSNLETTETGINAKKDNLVVCNSLPESEIECENSEEKCREKTTDILNGETNSFTQDQEVIGEFSEVKESFQISENGSDVSSDYEQANTAKDQIQASPDTATKDDNSLSNKISNFLGKWNYSQDSEVSSSKKTEETLNHPYLSKVSGRRGIKDRLNSSTAVFSSEETGAKTPENLGISLDDSFRVRTNPPCFNPSDLKENSTLRKFKGKRCLNADDEPEENDDMYLNAMKRRKLEKNQESGILGSILWSPFKKKSFDNEGQLKLATAESKLSRLLSPFWFWKKTATNQNGK